MHLHGVTDCGGAVYSKIMSVSDFGAFEFCALNGKSIISESVKAAGAWTNTQQPHAAVDTGPGSEAATRPLTDTVCPQCVLCAVTACGL